MKKIILLLVMSGLFFFSACTGNEGQSTEKENQTEESAEKAPETEMDAAYKEVMAIHDEVMPRMGEINRLKRTIKEKLETDQAELEQGRVDLMNTAVQNLEEADSLMMAWMATFNEGYKKIKEMGKEEAAMEYLRQEKEKIKYVKNRMLNSIKLGTVLTENAEN